MQATAETIWAVPAYLPYLQPPITAKAIVETERKIGYRLPDEYLELLRSQNGGYIRFCLPDMVHDTIAGIGLHFPSLTQFEWDEHQESVSFPLRGLVPFDGDGHWYLCLDYRKDSHTPSISYVDVECDQQSRVAVSFADYLKKLRIKVRNHYFLESIDDLDALKAKLSSELGTTFEPPDTWAHGYASHGARLGKGKNPEWLWISPNTVPRGFVRTEDPRYEELKDRMPGQGDRYPGLPAKSYILTISDRKQRKVLDNCERLGLKVRPLRGHFGYE